MYSDMSIRIMACSVSNMNSASARASSVLPTPVGPMNRKVPIGRFGSWSPALELLLGVAPGGDGVLLGLPLGLHRAAALAQVRELALDRLATRHRRLVRLLLERLLLDLELHHPALDLVDFGRHRVDLDAQLG